MRRTPRHRAHPAPAVARGAHPARAGNRLRPAAAALALAIAFVAGLAGSGVLARWNQALAPLPAISLGTIHLAVGDPQPGGAALPEPYSTSWLLPTAGFGTPTQPLSPGSAFAVAVQLDSMSQGNRGLGWTLDSVTVDDPTGTGYLAAHMELRAVEVAQPQACTVEAAASGTALYAGPLSTGAIASQVAVPAGASGGKLEDPVITYLCLSLTLDPTLATAYRNVGTVTALGQGTVGDPVDVSASDEWNAHLVPPAGATTPTVTFGFAAHTFRGDQP